MNDKVIVTNVSALKAKYGDAVSDITDAINRLIAKDQERGIQSVLVAIDSAADMAGMQAPPVTNPADPRQNKNAIDAVYAKLVPDYLLILGSVDVIPHQDLKNPVYHPPDDPDNIADGDLPYACEAPYSRNPEDFIGPTRVVGRLPDLTAATDPSYLIDLLTTAANYRSASPAEYSDYFSVSAAVWTGSTQMSLDNLFGSNNKLNLSPVEGPNWTAPVIGARLHFINCHGAPSDYKFYGQQGGDYPVAHDASLLGNKITEGTVAAVECCYGAELFDSSLGDGQIGICNEYLAGKAYGFFGSTTIAYGPANTNGSADLLCQYFLKYVREGASLGRAALQARQDFASSSATLDPVDLKTIAQFNLLGDPSITPVELTSPHNMVEMAGITDADADVAAKRIERVERRQQLNAKGLWLSENQSVVSSEAQAETSVGIENTMKKIADRVKIKNPSVLSFSVEQRATSKSLAGKGLGETKFHVMVEDQLKGAETANNEDSLKVSGAVCVVAKEVNGNIVSFRELLAK